jgi:MoaA/NifB/PqqE/SkfB family radical SAM enzyme
VNSGCAAVFEHLMRFPLRLTADLAIGLATKTLRGATRHHLILHLSPVAASRSPSPIGSYSSESVSDALMLPSEVCLDAVRRSSAPIVWIGGVEPFLHPEIGRLARRIVDTSRHVFVRTDGALLRRRIHEFRPVSRLFLTVQFDGFGHLHDRRSGREGAFRSAVEGIRTAKLSGFLVCAQMTLHANTALAELEQLQGYLEARDVDGFIVTPAHGVSEAVSEENESQALQSKLRAARDQMRSRRWRLFSQLLDFSVPMSRAIAPSDNAPVRAATAAADACEESVDVP